MGSGGLADARTPSVLIAAGLAVPEPLCRPMRDGSAARSEALPVGVKTSPHGRREIIARCLSPDAPHTSSSKGTRMTPHLIALAALLVFPLVALGSGMLVERLMGRAPERNAARVADPARPGSKYRSHRSAMRLGADPAAARRNAGATARC